MGRSSICWNGTSALQPEEITSKGTRVSCVYKSAHTKKKSGNLFNDPRTYLKMHICKGICKGIYASI